MEPQGEPRAAGRKGAEDSQPEWVPSDDRLTSKVCGGEGRAGSFSNTFLAVWEPQLMAKVGQRVVSSIREGPGQATEMEQMSPRRGSNSDGD